MNRATDPPDITLYRDHTPPAGPHDAALIHPATGQALTPQQAALLLALAQQHTPAPAPVAPVETRASGRAKDTALVMAAGGGGLGAATAGIGYGSGLIASASGGLMTAAVALAIASGSIGIGAWLLRAAFSRTDTPTAGAEQQQPTTHITQNITATGLFGKANGTVHHR
ncbi:hypothetical protein E1265_18520 [Streptomyces sp. 8K308]|uniref:hypothetical protein n=1 Tax=Streptomyces sp. 8K308 TaxID=2530388 RepID=UPI001051F33D|nr:hypothetical protein [Streptomyces sp. 8K308]TDC21247.1 hypothetical protein E1265_18520 [Streptomyces sp. 8K308]